MARFAYAVILTRDIEGLAAFYRAVLQVEPELSGAYAQFATGPGTLGLWSVDGYREIAGAKAAGDQGTGGVMLEFEVDDVDAEYRRLQALSEFRIDFVIPPTTLAWGNRSIYFRDPEGNLVNLFTPTGSR